MIVIYHDVGGAHSTAVAANIHVNKLPNKKIPDKEQILKLPTYDKISKEQIGHLLYIGEDEFGAKIYTLGRKYSKKHMVAVVTDMFNILKKGNEKLYIVDTHPTVNLWMKIGGFSSRALGLVSFGRPIVTFGTLKAYMNIAEIVENTKQQIKKDLKK